MPLVLDVQGFKNEKNQFLIKEFAGYNGSYTFHCIFKPPFEYEDLSKEYKKQANWLMAYHHCIDWEAGFTDYNLFPNIIQHLTKNVVQVYVKGKEKADYLSKFLKTPVLTLPESPPLQQQQKSCFFHSRDICMCALTNVYTLYNCLNKTIE